MMIFVVVFVKIFYNKFNDDKTNVHEYDDNDI